MQNSALMRVVDGFGDGLDAGRGLSGSERLVANKFAETLAFDEFHGKKGLAVVLTDFVNGDDVGMLQAGGSLGFGAKSFDEWVAGKLSGEEHFDGDDAIQRALTGAIDHAHAPAG